MLPDGTWYCEICDRRFDSESIHVDVDDLHAYDRAVDDEV